MKTFDFFNQAEQEHGDELGIALTLPDGFDVTRESLADNTEDFVYSVTQNGQAFFKFRILPVVEGVNLPAAVVLRERGDSKESTLEAS